MTTNNYNDYYKDQHEKLKMMMTMYLSTKHLHPKKSMSSSTIEQNYYIDSSTQAKLKRFFRHVVSKDIFRKLKFLPNDWVEKCTEYSRESSLGGRLMALLLQGPEEISNLFQPSSKMRETAWMYCMDAFPYVLTVLRGKVTSAIKKRWQRGKFYY